MTQNFRPYWILDWILYWILAPRKSGIGQPQEAESGVSGLLCFNLFTYFIHVQLTGFLNQFTE